MNLQDCSDSNDDSDVDYKPPGEEEHLSEIDSDDPIEDEEDIANTSATKSKKRVKGKRGSQKNNKKIKIDDETVEKTMEEVDTLLNSSEEDKKRLEALWEEFQRPVPKKSNPNTPSMNDSKSKSITSTKMSSKPETVKKRNFEELFDSTDSSKKVENNGDDATKSKSSEQSTVNTPPIKKQPGGLASVLSQLGKEKKLTILEKSKQDWDGYKKKEGIVEELITHNKGKDGYLEKRDFLERTDLRQFELEKAMRSANRSRRN